MTSRLYCMAGALKSRDTREPPRSVSMLRRSHAAYICMHARAYALRAAGLTTSGLLCSTGAARRRAASASRVTTPGPISRRRKPHATNKHTDVGNSLESIAIAYNIVVHHLINHLAQLGHRPTILHFSQKLYRNQIDKYCSPHYPSISRHLFPRLFNSQNCLIFLFLSHGY